MKIGFRILILQLIVLLLGCSSSQKEITLTVHNPSSVDRENEIVEISWEEVQLSLSLTSDQTIIVTDESGLQLPYQLITNGTDEVQDLIFPVSIKAGQAAAYKVSVGAPKEFKILVYGRLVPERMDDFTWENNLTAFRVYGPALKATGEISNGMDFWAKSTDELIIDKWYENDLSRVASYHTDHGEGLDFYTVGRTLGLGVTAPVHNDTLCLGDNFNTAKILDNGPLRISFKLTYDPYLSGGKEIIETRKISLDANSYFNRVTTVFETEESEPMTVATGIVTHEENLGTEGIKTTFGDNSGIIAYENPADKVNGIIYTAAIRPNGFGIIKTSNGHFLGLNSYKPGSEYTYFAGGGWSKSGFNSFDEWVEFLKVEKQKIDQALTINIAQ